MAKHFDLSDANYKAHNVFWLEFLKRSTCSFANLDPMELIIRKHPCNRRWYATSYAASVIHNHG